MTVTTVTATPPEAISGIEARLAGCIVGLAGVWAMTIRDHRLQRA